MLRCLVEDDVGLVLAEVHEDISGSRIAGRALENKLLRDIVEFVY